MDALWNFSFNKFFTPKVIGFIYGLGLLYGIYRCLSAIFNGFRLGGFLSGIGMFVLAPIVLFVYIVFLRVILESLVAIIKIAEESVSISKATQLTAENTRKDLLT